MATVDTASRVRAYLIENFLYMRRDSWLDEDERLLDSGILDSMGVMELMSFLEDEFGVEVADAEITEQNLGSVRSIANYIDGKLDACGCGALVLDEVEQV